MKRTHRQEEETGKNLRRKTKIKSKGGRKWKMGRNTERNNDHEYRKQTEEGAERR